MNLGKGEPQAPSRPPAAFSLRSCRCSPVGATPPASLAACIPCRRRTRSTPGLLPPRCAPNTVPRNQARNQARQAGRQAGRKEGRQHPPGFHLSQSELPEICALLPPTHLPKLVPVAQLSLSKLLAMLQVLPGGPATLTAAQAQQRSGSGGGGRVSSMRGMREGGSMNEGQDRASGGAQHTRAGRRREACPLPRCRHSYVSSCRRCRWARRRCPRTACSWDFYSKGRRGRPRAAPGTAAGVGQGAGGWGGGAAVLPGTCAGPPHDRRLVVQHPGTRLRGPWEQRRRQLRSSKVGATAGTVPP